MLKSPILKYVAGPQKFAYMPPILAGVALGGGLLTWFIGVAAGIGALPGLIWGIIGGAISAYIGLKEPHTHDILLARQQFMSKKPSLIPAKKGNIYVA